MNACSFLLVIFITIIELYIKLTKNFVVIIRFFIVFL